MIHAAIERFRESVHSTDIATYSQAALALRRWMIANDPHYPVFHFVGPESWINDPNGPIYHEGRYHLFYQFDPMVRGELGGGNRWVRSKRCWGHAVSTDLVHWADWPVALWPDSDQDFGGVYSGNTIIDDEGTPCALYTGNTTGNDGLRYGILARSHDGMVTWEKQVAMDHHERPNPDTPVHHDAYTWKRGDTWYQLVAGTTGGSRPQGAAFLWTSKDLVTWTFEKNIAPSIQLGEFWELPYLIGFAGRDVLFVGHRNPYWVGHYDTESLIFTADSEEPKQIDTGAYYSFNFNMTDDHGPAGAARQLMHGWVTGPATPTPEVPYWQGCHSIPRVIALSGDAILQQPIPEVECLRDEHHHFTDIAAAEAGLAGIQGDALEITMVFRPDAQSRVGFDLRRSADGSEYTRVALDAHTGVLTVDGPTPARNEREMTGIKPVCARLEPANRKPLNMRIFLDRSIIEVFVNGRALTARTFPPRDALGVKLYYEGGEPGVRQIDVYTLRSVW
jgi:beta-fructofuranosidase